MLLGLWSNMACRNMPGSNPGTVTMVPCWYRNPDMVTFIAKMWYIGSTQIVVSS